MLQQLGFMGVAAFFVGACAASGAAPEAPSRRLEDAGATLPAAPSNDGGSDNPVERDAGPSPEQEPTSADSGIRLYPEPFPEPPPEPSPEPSPEPPPPAPPLVEFAQGLQVQVTPIVLGADCQYGGLAIAAGQDADRDSVLTAGETIHVKRVCSTPSEQVLAAQDFGARGDGVTDDSAALQAALDALVEHGGRLELAANATYLISTGLHLSGGSRFEIDGKGALLRMVDSVPSTAGNHLLLIEGATGFQIRNLNLDGNRYRRNSALTPAHALILRHVSNFLLTEVAARDSVTDGIYVGATNELEPQTFSTDGMLLSCHSRAAFSRGLAVAGAARIQVIGGSYTSSNGATWPAGISIEPDVAIPPGSAREVLVAGAYISGNARHGLRLARGGVSHRIVYNRISNNGTPSSTTPWGAGLVLASSASIVSTNAFDDYQVSERGILDIPSLADFSNATNLVTGNTFSDIETTQPVIYIHRCSGNGNEVRENALSNYTWEPAIWNRNPTSALSGNTCNDVLCLVREEAPVDCPGRPM